MGEATNIPYFHWMGNVDEIKISDIARYTCDSTPCYEYNPPSDENDYLAYYKFHEGSGDILYDYSGNQNHGTISGAEWDVNEEEYGCTDEVADNYDEGAVLDDGSCTYPSNSSSYLDFDGSTMVIVDDFLPNQAMSELSIALKFTYDTNGASSQQRLVTSSESSSS